MLKKCTYFVVFAFLCFFQQQGNAQVCNNCLPHTDPNNEGKWQIQANFSDEFNDGTINSKWHKQGTGGDYYNGWRGRSPSQFVPENITESNRTLKITSKWQPGFKFFNGSENKVKYGSVPITTGALITKSYLRHGYIEIRCKVGKSPMSGAFWGVDTSNVGELDVFEHVGRSWDDEKDNKDIPTIMHSSFHTWRTNRPGGNNRVFQHKHKLGFDVTDGFHVYAADWTANYVRFYVDGRLVREITKANAQKIQFGPTNGWVVDTPMRLWLDAEIFSWEGSLDKLRSGMFGNDKSFFEVDYVRVWKRRSGGSTAKKGHGPNLVRNGNFASNLGNWNITGVSSRPNISGWKFWKDDNPTNDNFCLQLGGGPGTAKQTITVKPNTRYMLTAHLRMPGTTATVQPKVNTSIFHDGFYGVENYGGARIEKKMFLNFFHGYSIEFRTGASNTRATIFFDNKRAGNPMHVDQVSVVEMKDLRGGGTTPPPPPTASRFYIINRGSGQKLRPANANEGVGIQQVNASDTSNWVKWEKVNSDNGWFYFKNVRTGKYFRPKGGFDDGNTLEQRSASFAGNQTQWKEFTANGGYVFLRNRASGKNIRPKTGAVNSLIELRPATWVGNWTQWKLQPVGTSKTLVTKELDNATVIYPNPSNGVLNIETNVEVNTPGVLTIQNLRGQTLFTKSINSTKTTINSNLQRGMYLLRLSINDEQIVKKIVIE